MFTQKQSSAHQMNATQSPLQDLLFTLLIKANHGSAKREKKFGRLNMVERLISTLTLVYGHFNNIPLCYYISTNHT